MSGETLNPSHSLTQAKILLQAIFNQMCNSAEKNIQQCVQTKSQLLEGKKENKNNFCKLKKRKK